MPGTKEVTLKPTAIRKGDKRFKPKQRKSCRMKENGNFLSDPKYIKPPPPKNRFKELCRHIKGDKGFPMGRSKYDKRDIMSIPSGISTEKPLTKKPTQVRLKIPRSSKKKNAAAGNSGDILSIQSGILKQKISGKITANSPTQFSKVKRIPRREKMKYPARYVPPVQDFGDDKVAAKPGSLKYKKSAYREGLKRAKNTGNFHTPFEADKSIVKNKLATKITQSTPTGVEIVDKPVDKDYIFGETVKKKPFKRPEFHAPSYSQFKFSEMFP